MAGRLNEFLTKFNGSSREYAVNTRTLFDVKMYFNSDGKSWIPANLMQDLSLFVQSIEIPNFKVASSRSFKTPIGNVIIPTGVVIPENNILTIDFLNTEKSIVDNCILPWMREVTYPWWSNKTTPYTTAKVVVDFLEMNTTYVFTGVRPCQVETPNPRHDPDNTFTRQAQFEFNFMYVNTK